MTRDQAKKDKIRKRVIAIMMIHAGVEEIDAKAVLHAFRVAGLQIIEKGQ